MWVRAAGLVCVFLGCCLAGVEKERRLKQRWLLLRELRETVFWLEKETAWRRAALPEAMDDAAGGCHTALGEMLRQAADTLRRRQGRAVREIWEQAFSACIPTGLLTADERDAFLDVSLALGSTDGAALQTMLGSCGRRLEKHMAQAERDWHEKGMLYRRISAAGGAFLLILLA